MNKKKEAEQEVKKLVGYVRDYKTTDKDGKRKYMQERRRLDKALKNQNIVIVMPKIENLKKRIKDFLDKELSDFVS